MNKAVRPKRFDKRIMSQIYKLQKTNNFTNLFHISKDYIIISFAVFFCLNFFNLFTYILSLLFIGSRMRALNNLVHEASHKVLFKNKQMNELIGSIFCAYPVFTSLHTYRKSHMVHHRLLGDPIYDPDYIRYKELGMDKLPMSKKLLWLNFASVIFMMKLPKYILGTISSYVIDSETPVLEKLKLWGFWLVVVAVSIIFGFWQELLLFWIVPFLTTFQIIRYFAELSEHGGLYGNEYELEIARNNFAHPILRFFLYPHNDYYHLVHHLIAAVPHFNLPKAHEILKQDEEYNKAHHCFGYFLPLKADSPSIMQEMST